MSGHSKWSTIKRKKGAADQKRGAVFTKIANMITIAAREGGGDPSGNSALAVAIEKGRQANMPKENIERAIKRGTGELEGVSIEEMQIEAYGPSGSAFIIKAITDNKNRTISEIRNILSKHNGKMAESGSVAYQFAKKGVIVISNPSDDLELAAIEAGAQDTKTDDGQLIVYTATKDLESVQKSLVGAKIESADIELLPQTTLELSTEDSGKITKLAEALADNEDVSEVFNNLS